MILAAHHLRIDLPPRWSGRIYRQAQDVATLHAASFPIALDDGDFGDRSTAAMPADSVFIALTEYRPGAGLEPGRGLFAPRRIPRRLDPARLSVRGLAHPRPGQAGLQHFFTAAGRPFCLYVVVAATGRGRRRQVAAADHVLGTLEISARG